jgi:hypothetical protein
MKPILLDIKTGQQKLAVISKASAGEMPLKKDGWQFNWRSLAKTEGAMLFKISLEENPEGAEGMLMLSLMFDEMLYMNNIEVAPQNYGKDGRYENIAGCLLAFACRMSMTHGKGAYKGYLTFDSKTELIELYRNKYGATPAMGQKMFFTPKAGDMLMEKYLGIPAGF